jgi:hypothetical protein
MHASFSGALLERRDTSGFSALGIVVSIATTDADATLDQNHNHNGNREHGQSVYDALPR